MLGAEQNRTVVSLEKTALAWDRREGDALKTEADTPSAEQQGRAAYAARQADLQRRLKAKCQRLWGFALAKLDRDTAPTTAAGLPMTAHVSATVESDDEDEELRILGDHEVIDED